MKFNLCVFLTFALFLLKTPVLFAQGDVQLYLKNVKEELKKEWPKNKTINLVFHGHSVPSGYFNTPNVNTLQTYPYLLLKELKRIYPYAVINVIVTAIGGENSLSGQKRFENDVLIYKPDVLFIDYALNDRVIGLEKAREATEKMITAAKERGIKVILVTPSPDQRVDMLKPGNELEKFSDQLISLSKKYDVGLADGYKQFLLKAQSAEGIKPYMSWVNHPNEKGHQLIAGEILKWFVDSLF